VIIFYRRTQKMVYFKPLMVITIILAITVTPLGVFLLQNIDHEYSSFMSILAFVLSFIMVIFLFILIKLKN